MRDSLIISDTIELLGGGVTLTDGPGAGATLRLGNDYKMGAPVIDDDTVASLLLDGERPYGERASNRTMTLPVVIIAPGRIKVEQAREQLLELVDQQAWTLTYKPRGLQAIVFDCFRATIDTDQTGLAEANQEYALVSLTFQAYPYGRSTDYETLVIPPDPSAQGSPVLLDAFDSPPGDGWYIATLPVIQGAHSTYTWEAGTAVRTFAAKDLTGTASIRVWAAIAGARAPRTLTLTLYDAAGHSYNMGAKTLQVRGNYGWDVFTWPFTPPATFDVTQLYGYRLKVSGGVYLDALAAMPPWQHQANSSRGGVVTIPGVKGTARAPVNLKVYKPAGGTFYQFVLHRPPADAPQGYTPLVPLDATLTPTGTEQAFPDADGISKGLRFNGSYIVGVNFSTFGGGSATRDVTVVLRQHYNDAGVTAPGGGALDHDSKTLGPITLNSGDGPMQVLGSIDLPITDGPLDNSAATWTISVQSSITTDRISEVMLLDTRGETLWVNSPRACTQFFVDEPNTLRDPFDFVGRVSGGSSRAQALSVASSAILPARPFSVEPGDDSQLLQFSPAGALTTEVLYASRWRTVRLA